MIPEAKNEQEQGEARPTGLASLAPKRRFKRPAPEAAVSEEISTPTEPHRRDRTRFKRSGNLRLVCPPKATPVVAISAEGALPNSAVSPAFAQ